MNFTKSLVRSHTATCCWRHYLLMTLTHCSVLQNRVIKFNDALASYGHVNPSHSHHYFNCQLRFHSSFCEFFSICNMNKRLSIVAHTEPSCVWSVNYLWCLWNACIRICNYILYLFYYLIINCSHWTRLQIGRPRNLCSIFYNGRSDDVVGWFTMRKVPGLILCGVLVNSQIP
jgi:hypothetical protein